MITAYFAFVTVSFFVAVAANVVALGPRCA